MKQIESIDDLTPDSRNANLGTERGRGMLEQSLREFGAGRSILVDKEGVVIAGNKTLEVAEELGLPVRVVTTNGGELVVVQRRDLDLDDGDKARRLAYMDNRSGQVGLDWDAAQILADLETDVDLSGLWTDAEIADLLAGVMEESPEDPGPQIDRAEELREKWGVERGQIWEIGRHRLMCGDTTSPQDVVQLLGGMTVGAVVTDPPYGLGAAKSFNEDHPHYEDSEPFDLSLLSLLIPFVIWGGQYYDWLPLPRNKIGWIVWDKRPNLEGEKRTRADRRFGQHFEIAVTNISALRGRMYRQRWGGYYGTEEILHKTQKPTELFQWCIASTSGIVIDYFLGSGTTMVAAEQTGRICYGMEIFPPYVAVTLERMQGMGLKARLLIDGCHT